MTFDFSSKLRSRQELGSESGFTLIELLVVILIIGILAAIAIPSFLAQRSKGQDACAKSMARTMQTAMESYATSNQGNYSGADVPALSGIENQVTNGQCGAGTTISVGLASTAAGDCDTGAAAGGEYCVSATSQSGNAFTIARANSGAIARVCLNAANNGGCPGSGASGTW